MGCEKLKFQNCFFFVSSCLCGKKTQSVATGSAIPNKFLYRYDPIGNRTKFKSSPPSVLLSYTSNNLNQYTKIKSSEPSGISKPTYDEFGNMTQCSLGFQPETSWSFSWNLHNRLVAAKSADTRLTFTYDPNGRRVMKKVYKKSGTGSWSLITDHRFLYSGFKCIAEIDALKNKVIQTYSWAGEQILGRHTPKNKKSLFYVSDGNKNIIGMINKKGNLKVVKDYNPDKNPPKKGLDSEESSREIRPPKGMNQKEWDKKVRESGEKELEKQKKKLRQYEWDGGDEGKTSGNCNCVTRQIIEGEGGKIPADYDPQVRTQA